MTEKLNPGKIRRKHKKHPGKWRRYRRVLRAIIGGVLGPHVVGPHLVERTFEVSGNWQKEIKL